MGEVWTKGGNGGHHDPVTNTWIGSHINELQTWVLLYQPFFADGGDTVIAHIKHAYSLVSVPVLGHVTKRPI